jgi:hypothetical protein
MCPLNPIGIECGNYRKRAKSSGSNRNTGNGSAQ